MAYASESIALATLEVLVHLQSTSVLSSYSLATARFPGTLIEEIDASSLPPRWRSYPSPPELQAIGDRWAQEQRSAILRVPSVLVPSEANLLLNPTHRDFSKVTIEPPQPFELDLRLLR